MISSADKGDDKAAESVCPSTESAVETIDCALSGIAAVKAAKLSIPDAGVAAAWSEDFAV